jgi:hypothetical protein
MLWILFVVIPIMLVPVAMVWYINGAGLVTHILRRTYTNRSSKQRPVIQ